MNDKEKLDKNTIKKNKHPHLDHIKFKDFSPSPRRHHKYYVYQLTLERGTNI